MKQNAIFKLSGEKWAAMSEKDKEPYTKKSEADKVRYEKQVAENLKQGWFKMADGTKSTDPNNAKLFKAKKSKSEKNAD